MHGFAALEIARNYLENKIRDNLEIAQSPLQHSHDHGRVAHRWDQGGTSVNLTAKNVHQKRHLLKSGWTLPSQILLTLLGSIANVTGGTPVWLFNKNKNLHLGR